MIVLSTINQGTTFKIFGFENDVFLVQIRPSLRAVLMSQKNGETVLATG